MRPEILKKKFLPGYFKPELGHNLVIYNSENRADKTADYGVAGEITDSGANGRIHSSKQMFA